MRPLHLLSSVPRGSLTASLRPPHAGFVAPLSFVRVLSPAPPLFAVFPASILPHNRILGASSPRTRKAPDPQDVSRRS